MKNKVIAIFALTALLAMGSVAQEESEMSAGLDLSVLSAYVWRGQVLNEEAVVQPSLTVTKGGFSINWWGNFNLTDDITGEEYEFSEHDISAWYNWVCPKTEVSLTGGLVQYDFPNQSLVDGEGNVSLVNDTHEAFVIVGLPILLSPTASAYYDFKEAEGFYYNLAVSHSLELSDKVSATLGASAGYGSEDYNAFYFGVAEDEFNDANFTLTVPIAVNDTLTVTPGVQYTMLINSDIEDAAEGLYKDTEQVVGSLKASIAF